MIPDMESMILMVRGIEKMGAELGWDNNPGVLGFFFETADGEGFATSPFPEVMQPCEMAPNDPRAGLYRLARLFNRPANALFASLENEGSQAIAGIWFCSEGYFNDTITDEERDGRHMADVVGSVEVRTVDAIDCAGRYYSLIRKRGEEPTTEVIDKGYGDLQVSGFIPMCMREILYGIAAGMPFGSADLDAIRSIAAADVLQ